MKAPSTSKPSKKMARRPKVIVKGSEKYSTFKAAIALIASGFIATHLIICLLLIARPNVTIFGNRTLAQLYLRYALTGPFFKDELIKSSPHFYIAGKKGRVWEQWRNPELDNFNTFHHSYWLYFKLKQSSLEQNLAGNLYRKILKNGEENFTTYRQFNQVRNYFESEYFKEQPDSIRMLYTKSTYKPRERKTKIDTLFFLKYKPW